MALPPSRPASRTTPSARRSAGADDSGSGKIPRQEQAGGEAHGRRGSRWRRPSGVALRQRLFRGAIRGIRWERWCWPPEFLPCGVATGSGETFAIKSVDRSNLANDLDRELAELEPKLAQLAGTGNPGVVQVHVVYEDDSWTHMVMDLCSGPDLLDWVRLRRGAPVPELVAADIVAQVAQAVAHCHRRGVTHCDIKPDNIDADEDGENVSPRAQLADFGSAAWIGVEGGRVEGLVGTPHYVAPEVVSGEDYGEKADVWSAGVVMYVLLSGGALPFGGETAKDVLSAVMREASGSLRGCSPACLRRPRTS